MFIVTFTRFGEAPRRYDLHQLPLPSGKMVHQLPGPDLYRELLRNRLAQYRWR